MFKSLVRRFSNALPFSAGVGTEGVALVIVGVIAVVVAVSLVPTMISSWVTAGNSTGITSAADSLADIGQLVAVAFPIIVIIGLFTIGRKVLGGSK